MKATRILLRFLMASLTAFTALHYFGSSYESLLLSIADRLIHGLNFGARLIHDSNDQLCIVMFLPGGPSQFKIAGFDWIYAGQATAVGVVLSTYAPSGRKVFWMTIVSAMMALIHTTLLVLAVAEFSKQINGANGDIAVLGAIVFKLYRIVVPVLLASMWVYCSREALSVAGVVKYFEPLHEPDNKTPGWRIGGVLVGEDLAGWQGWVHARHRTHLSINCID